MRRPKDDAVRVIGLLSRLYRRGRHSMTTEELRSELEGIGVHLNKSDGTPLSHQGIVAAITSTKRVFCESTTKQDRGANCPLDNLQFELEPMVGIQVATKGGKLTDDQKETNKTIRDAYNEGPKKDYNDRVAKLVPFYFGAKGSIKLPTLVEPVLTFSEDYTLYDFLKENVIDLS